MRFLLPRTPTAPVSRIAPSAPDSVLALDAVAAGQDQPRSLRQLRPLRSAAWVLGLFAVCCLFPLAGHAKTVQLDIKHFGTRDFSVSQGGVFTGVVVNVSDHVFVGLQVDIEAQDANGAQLWTRSEKLSTLKPNQRAPLQFFVGSSKGLPASYLVKYLMDDAAGKNPDDIVTTQRKQVGFTVKGSGDMLTKYFTLEPGEKTIALEYQGADEVRVLLRNRDGSVQTSLFELQGPDNATTTVMVEAKDEYAFYTDGDGAWVLQLKDDSMAAPAPSPRAPESTTPQDTNNTDADSGAAAPRARQHQLILE